MKKKTLSENYLSLAAFCYKSAARNAANGDTNRATSLLKTARAHDAAAIQALESVA